MNLHTAMIMKLKEKTDIKKQNAVILRKIDSVLKNIDDLREDPLFIDNIHGEQELSLDQTIELLCGIRTHFVTDKKDKELPIGFESSSFDVS
tara:strand:+ start:230 stop:505 length:276 start_codon:yes stop_codon:yes gene_type:complete